MCLIRHLWIVDQTLKGPALTQQQGEVPLFFSYQLSSKSCSNGHILHFLLRLNCKEYSGSLNHHPAPYAEWNWDGCVVRSASKCAHRIRNNKRSFICEAANMSWVRKLLYGLLWQMLLKIRDKGIGEEGKHKVDFICHLPFDRNGKCL